MSCHSLRRHTCTAACLCAFVGGVRDCWSRRTTSRNQGIHNSVAALPCGPGYAHAGLSAKKKSILSMDFLGCEGISYLNEGFITAMMRARKWSFTGVYAGVAR